MLKELEPDIKFYLAAEYPKEGCGLIIDGKSPEFLPCENVADNATKRFQIARKVKENFAGKILAVVHSHADGLRCPSASDMWGQIEMQIPWGIARSTHGGSEDLFWFGDQIKKSLLIGRGFRHGVTDCYSLVRDWYLEEKNIKLKDFPRNWEWWKGAGVNLYESSFPKAGFRKLLPEEKPQIGDLCLMRIRSKVINHAAILIDSELILHHPGGHREYQPEKLSIQEPIGRWQKYIEYWIRLHEAYQPEIVE